MSCRTSSLSFASAPSSASTARNRSAISFFSRSRSALARGALSRAASAANRVRYSAARRSAIGGEGRGGLLEPESLRRRQQAVDVEQDDEAVAVAHQPPEVLARESAEERRRRRELRRLVAGHFEDRVHDDGNPAAARVEDEHSRRPTDRRPGELEAAAEVDLW